ncbi:STAS domain-containing protein [Reichenbachiella carrageenanivorans]|uniref:STAS domain-containing protein n=1 Tax=Reichenbachiella carrageenanivorans TaxID=2979869 RepID=A0ABY6D7R5_9BACT|nr:STAS domain-containing protein [Reichenbachiella carrageenanivorans]UXX81198.1 STAS domain-containing protein [Reichenbachiella carrageenanivorans]
MKFTLDREEKYNTLKVDEEKLDSTISPDLKSEFLTIQGQGITNLIVDLSDVKYIDSSGLSAILVGNRVFSEAEGSFILAGVSDHAMKLIKISQLDNVLNILPTVEEAVDAVFMNELEQGLAEEED